MRKITELREIEEGKKRLAKEGDLAKAQAAVLRIIESLYNISGRLEIDLEKAGLDPGTIGDLGSYLDASIRDFERKAIRELK